jgi:hypothetical protein
MTLLDVVLALGALAFPWLGWAAERLALDPRWPASNRGAALAVIAVLALCSLACLALAVNGLSRPFDGIPADAPVVHRFVLAWVALALGGTVAGVMLSLVHNLILPPQSAAAVAPAVQPRATAPTPAPPPRRAPTALDKLDGVRSLPVAERLPAADRLVRAYLSERFGIPVDRRTSNEIIDRLSTLAPPDVVAPLGEALAAADAARYSGRHPDAATVSRAVLNVRRFVERTLSERPPQLARADDARG